MDTIMGLLERSWDLGLSEQEHDCDDQAVPSGSASGLCPSGLDSSVRGFSSDPKASTGFSSFDDVLCHPPLNPKP